VADAAAIPAGSWADKIKQRGKLVRGGTDAGPLFSIKDPATGKVTGFDAGLAAMLAHYITGKPTDNTAITKIDDLNGKNVATESNSTAALAVKQFAPQANVLLFQEDAQCVAAVQQGRAEAYVLDQAILISDASTNPAVKVVGEPFTQEPYGIGVPLGDPSAKQFVNDWLQKIYADGSWAKLWQATIGTVVKDQPPTPPTVGSA